MSGQRWSGELGFLLGAVGAAVGLGSIWRFPYLAGAGGGFAFIAVFALACVVIGAPLLIAETVIGRAARVSPQQAGGVLAARYGHSRGWSAVGWIGPLAGFVIATYYTMIAGWVLAYAWFFLSGDYAHGTAAAVARFRGFCASPLAVTAWQAGFCALVALTSARGVNRGVELANRWRAPALLAILLVLVAYSLAVGDVGRGLAFAFAPDLTRLTPPVLLDAVGQACFALGLSAGIIVAYGAYMPAGEPLGRSVVAVIGSILAVSFLATLVIFPLVFHYGLDPAGGIDLVFQVLPVAFAEMPGGRWIGALFFALLVLAAFTPTIGIIEPWVAWLGERYAVPRAPATFGVVLAALAAGQLSVQSFAGLAGWHPLAGVPRFATATPFALLDFASGSVLMPLSALALSVFLGWRLGRQLPTAEYSGLSPRVRALTLFALRYLCPVGLAIVLVVGLRG
ncbi:MAG: sodium-dependent transporter [Proteobacteria bacterium]|nr:sodium-dependent transporter [Pseudomonadota bacterium]